MKKEEKLKIIKQYQQLADETIENSYKMLEISKRDGRELDIQTITEHIEFLKRRKEELKNEYEHLEKELNR